MFVFVPAFYPGADLGVSMILTVALTVFVALLYWTFSVSMPRSGGDYVFMTRSLNPLIGFAFNWGFTLFYLWYGSYGAWGVTNLGLSPLLSVLSMQTGNAALAGMASALLQPLVVFIVGAIAILLTAVILLTGTRRAFTLVSITFLVAMICFVAMLILIGVTSRESFISEIHSLAGVNYQATIASGVSAGFVPNASFNWSATINSMVWPWFMFPFGMQSVALAGEIKNIKRTQFIGIPGALAFSTVLVLLLWYLTLGTVGYQFLGAVGYLGTTGTNPVFPYLNVLAGLMTNNIALSTIVTAGLLFWTFGWVPVNMLYGTRAIFAWGVDRILPEYSMSVSERFHTPKGSLVATTLVSLFFLGLLSFIPAFGTLSGMVVLSACVAVIGVAGVLFPYTKKEIFEKSPAKIKIGSIPLVTICGIIVALQGAFFTYRYVVDSAAGANNPLSLLIVTALLLLGFVVWPASYLVRKKQGIDLMAAYRVLPIE
jgi:amino acid transporter